MSRCHLLVECQASVSRGDSNDKANGGAAVYRWNAALNRWTECHAALLTPLWPTKAHFFSPPEPGQAADGILGASLLSVLLPDAHFSFQEHEEMLRVLTLLNKHLTRGKPPFFRLLDADFIFIF